MRVCESQGAELSPGLGLELMIERLKLNGAEQQSRGGGLVGGVEQRSEIRVKRKNG